MSDLINRQMVLRCIRESRDNIDWGQSEDGDAFLHYTGALYRTIASEECLPSAERKRGEWIDGLDVPKEERERHPYVYLHGEKYCSVCYKEAYFDTDYGQQLFDFCPNCGADMRGDAE